MLAFGKRQSRKPIRRGLLVNKVQALVAGAGSAITGGIAALFVPYAEVKSPSLAQYQQRCEYALSVFRVEMVQAGNGRIAFTMGESWRPNSVAEHYYRTGRGIANSLHTKRLAVDLNLFIDGMYQSDGEAHAPLAKYWMQRGAELGVKPAAGYFFNDGNHYSCEWEGIK